jgi:hypothetical protein
MYAWRSSAPDMNRRILRRVVVIAAVVATVCGAAAVASASSLTVTTQHLGAVALPVTITTTSLTAVADTGTNQASPNTNTGTTTTMLVESATSANQRSFVRFDLSAIPATARVQSATLQLTMSTAPSATRTYEVDKVNASWVESILTWATMPAASAATATVASGTTSGVNLTWNVTTDAKTFVANSSTNFGWQIKDSSESSAATPTATFRTREWTTASQRPTLTVIYAT